MDELGKPKDDNKVTDMPIRRWDVVEKRGIEMDRSLPCVLCRRTAVGSGGGCCADCMISILLEKARIIYPVSVKELEKKWKTK
jgi:hypothetical protein